ncbi:cbb3-type cytochrome c oxidase subunit 3 [Marivibrio halodurans]|uniref:Cbb3-type cytochrome c oxidase subunit 3 n=1 Tax=Marivibrio halodurans TaxID=2039722 RepID=A0A8J7V435_9PROT|nr:cbb3-type cytochrome c oxidase subunit 3 [Marivibrio halodurans]MBP5858672.1 cbb3-type cytochrome c oxidase subunit 3 [Marivibrio halodurans]
MDYETFRHFADSWGLLYLVILFVGIVAFTFRPGGSKAARNAAHIPFERGENDE